MNDLDDWRLAFHAVAKEDNEDLAVKAGGSLTTGSRYLDGGKAFQFFLPSSTALFLEFALEQYGLALTAKQRSLTEVYKGFIKNQNIFAFFEHISAAVIFSMVALESFANESIPEDFYHEEKYKSVWKAIGKDGIERSVDLETKLGDILPKVFDQPTVKGTALWEKFLRLKLFRDRLVHFKTKDRHSLHPKHESLWDDLFAMKLDPPVQTAFSLVEHYVKGPIQQPWWIRNIPAGFRGPDPSKNVVK